jgi:CRP/FNR family cyclic AMP-dependent transcriptional regulator
MKVLKDFKLQNKCLDCDLRNSSFFCNFSPATLQSFESIKITNAYPKGSHLFIEGQPSNGIFMLCRGRVKLTTYSRNGKALILRIAVPGEILGLSAAISESTNETTAEVIETCQVNFVRKSEFCRFLEQNADAGMNALQQLSLQYKKAYMQVRSLALSTCVADKLATILLEWSKEAPSNNGSVHLKNLFSHEEIAEMIGTSRETVTRLLKDFRERNLISIKGSDFYIPDKHKLEVTIGNGKRPKQVR